MEDAVNVIDENHRVIYWNNAAARLYGIEGHEAIGRPLDELYSYQWLNVEGRESVLRDLRAYGYWKGECLHRLIRDNREILVEVSISTLRESNGVAKGFLAVIRDITARKRAEEARAQLEKERDELLRRLQSEVEETRYWRDRLNLQFERMPIGCIVWDTDFCVESWNPAAREIFGFSLEEVKGQHALQLFVPPEAQSAVGEIWQRLLQGDTAAHSVNENLARDGRRIICQWSNTPLLDRHGLVSGVLSMVQDITNRVRAEEDLRFSEERFRNTFEQAAVGVAHVDNEGRFLQVNRKLSEILRYSRQEMLSGMRFGDITHPDDMERENVLFEKAFQAHSVTTTYALEKRFLDKNGRVVWCSVTASFVKCREAEPYFVMVIEDIAARKQAEWSQRFLAEATSAFAASLDYEATLRTMARLCVEELADFCIVDLVGRGVAVDWPEGEESRVRRVAGWHRDTAKKPLVDKLLSYVPRLDAGWPSADAFASGRTVYLENCSDEFLRATTDDAEHFELVQDLDVRSCLIVPLVARGRVIGLVKLCNSTAHSFDRHEIALVEELMRRASLALENAHLYGEAQKARREAEAASRAKDEFLAVVSHELRTPLTPILGWVSTLLDSELSNNFDSETRRHALEAIQQGAEIQSQIIDDLLDVSRIISGNSHLHKHPTRLCQVIEAAVTASQHAAQKKNIEIFVCLEVESAVVQGETRRLQQVIGNLLSNAIKFTPSGGRVEVHLAADTENAQIKVSDNGIGIDKTFLPYVFDRFTQADTTASRSYGGLGLGLAIVRHLVELHGGTIEVRSAGLSQGATFTVTLPLVLAPHSAIPSTVLQENSKPEKPLDEATSAAKLVGLKFLIIDDESATRDMLSHIFKSAGAVMETADSASAAREILARWQPDLILSDIGMPDEDGYTFIKFVRSLHSADGGMIPAIALTAYARPQDCESALNAGFQMYLTKPVSPTDLIAAVLELLAL